MEFLGDGAPPFLAFAADRAGLRRGAVKEWMHAAEAQIDPDPLIVEFAARARKIRATYVCNAMVMMASCDAKSVAQANQLQWIITRIERDELHINPNPGKVVEAKDDKPKGESKFQPQLKPTDQKVTEASKGLEVPEPVH